MAQRCQAALPAPPGTRTVVPRAARGWPGGIPSGGMRIVVGGGTGFLGSALVERLRTDGHDVVVLPRGKPGPQHVRWDPYGSLQGWSHVLESAGAVINLAGASIAKRWTAA